VPPASVEVLNSPYLFFKNVSKGSRLQKQRFSFAKAKVLVCKAKVLVCKSKGSRLQKQTYSSTAKISNDAALIKLFASSVDDLTVCKTFNATVLSIPGCFVVIFQKIKTLLLKSIFN